MDKRETYRKFSAPPIFHSDRYSLGVTRLKEPEFAVACYTFTFRARRLTGLGKTIEEHIIDGRATQVFGCDPEGRIRMFHEHFSQAAP